MALGWWGRLLLTAVRQMRWGGYARLGSSVPLLCGVGPPCRIRRGCRRCTATGVPVLQHARWEHATPAAWVSCKSSSASRGFVLHGQPCLPQLLGGAGEIMSYKPEHSLALSEAKSQLLDPCFAKRQGRTAPKHYMES